MLQRQRTFDLRVVAPRLGAGGRVERNHRLVWSAQVETVTHLQRRDLVGGLYRVPGLAAQVTGLELPRHFQLCNVGRRDLRQWRKALAVSGAAISMPVAVGQATACAVGR